MTAYVKKATRSKGTVPTWQGEQDAAVDRAGRCGAGAAAAARRRATSSSPSCRPRGRCSQTQARLSRLPTPETLLVERFRSREGHHLFLYPFAGRHVHLGLASLLAWRLARDAPNTFSMSVNDYGFELLSAEPVDLAPLLDRQAVQRRPTCCTTCWRSLNSERAGAAALPRDRPRGRAWSSPATPAQPKSTQAAAGVERPVLRGVPQVRRRQPAARRRPSARC